MDSTDYTSRETQWTKLAEQYRETCDSPEAGRNFMPALWQRIEAKRARGLRFERAARSVFAAAMALSLVLGAFLMIPGQQPSVFDSGSFVEEIATAENVESGTFFEPVRLEITATERNRR